MKPSPTVFPAARLVVVFWILVWTAAAVSGQARAGGERQPAPRVGYVYPAGGCRGTVFRVALGGQHLGAAEAVLATGQGVSFRILDHVRPLTQKEYGEARERLELLRQKAGLGKEQKSFQDLPPGALAKLDEGEREELRLLRRRLREGNPRQLANPSISETLLLEVSIAADAKPGTRELRLNCENGTSNPLVFQVGTLPELCVDEVRAKPPEQHRPGDKQRAVPRTETRVTPPVVVNGQILQGGVDRLVFAARKGQRLVVAAEARALIPYLADAVPGWFQATLGLFDAEGRELAYNDDYRNSPDPVLLFEIPADGDYSVEIKDGIYRGRDDFVYRLTLGELPFVTGLFPCGGPAGASTRVELRGWNLPGTHSVVHGAGRGPGLVRLQLPGAGEASAPVPFEFSEDPERVENEAGVDPSAADLLSLPVVVNGRIGEPDDRDCFLLQGRAGQKLVVEVVARRLGSPLDSQLRLLDSRGGLVAFSDDQEDRGSGLNTHHADSKLLVTLPSDGVYQLELTDTQHQGGPFHVYRLQVREPRPGFELRCEPSVVNLRENATVPLTVHVLRQDGFDGPVALRLGGESGGLALSGGLVPPGVDRLKLTLTALGAADPRPRPLVLLGAAALPGGGSLVAEAVPCDDRMQAFSYRHLVVAQQQLVRVLEQEKPRPRLVFEQEERLRIRPGETVWLRLLLPRKNKALAGTLRFALVDAPEGLSLGEPELTGLGLRLPLSCDPLKAKAGLQGNLLVEVFVERESAGGKDKGRGLARQPAGFMPAVPFAIAEP